MRLGDGGLARIDLVDGGITQITSERGFEPKVSADGKFLYYFAKPLRSLDRLPVTGGTSERLLDGGNYEWAGEDPRRGEIYLVQMSPSKSNPLRCNLIRFDPERREAQRIISIDFRPKSAYVTRGFLYLYERDDPHQRVVVVRGL